MTILHRVLESNQEARDREVRRLVARRTQFAKESNDQLIWTWLFFFTTGWHLVHLAFEVQDRDPVVIAMRLIFGAAMGWLTLKSSRRYDLAKAHIKIIDQLLTELNAKIAS